jgi:transcriptional regulator with XRE-family HTH domain
MRKDSPQAPLLFRWGRSVRAHRMRAGLTQDQAATALGVPLKAWQRLETGRHNPTLETIGRVADALQVPVTDFFGAPLIPEVGLPSWLGLPAGWRWDASGVPVFVLSDDAPPDAPREPPEPGLVADPRRPLGYARPIGRRTRQDDGLILVQSRVSAPILRIEPGTWLLMRAGLQPPTLGSLVLMSTASPPSGPPWVLRRIGALDAPIEGGLRVRLDAMQRGGPSTWRSGEDASAAGIEAELALVLGPSMTV